MDSFLLIVFDELAKGLLGKVIGIGLIFSVAKTTIGQLVRFPDPQKLKNLGVMLEPSISRQIEATKDQHLRLTLIAWLLFPAYFAIRWCLIAAVPEDAIVIDGLAVFGVCALAVIPVISLCLTYYLAATELKARDLAQYGRT